MQRRAALMLVFASTVCTFVASLTAASVKPATGYEVSIYLAFPLWFWFIAATGYFLAAIAVIRGTGTSEIARFALLAGILSIGVIVLIRLTLPLTHGYAFYGRSDDMIHFGYVKDIAFTGFIGEGNFYAPIHIFTAALSSVTGIPLNTSFRMIPIVTTLTFTASAVVFARNSFGGNSAVVATALFCCLLFGHETVAFAPSIQAFLVLPSALLVLSIASRTPGRMSAKIMMVPLLLILVLIHPEVALVSALIMAVLGASFRLRTAAKKQSRAAGFIRELHHSGEALWASFFLIIVFSAWYLSFVIIGQDIKHVLESLFLGMNQSDLEKYGAIASMASVDIYDLIAIAVMDYGIAVIVSLGALLVVFRKDAEPDTDPPSMREGWRDSFRWLVPILIGLSILAFVFDVIVGISRVGKYLVLISTLAIVEGMSRPKNPSSLRKFTPEFARKFTTLAMVGIILSLSICNVYWSPFSRRCNEQVTDSEIRGMEFFFGHSDKTLEVKDLSVSPIRFYWFLFGKEAQPPPGTGSFVGTTPADHFGYSSNETYGQAVKTNQYLILNSLGRSYYQTVYPDFRNLWRFTDSDFESLEKDDSVSKLFDNGDLTIYFVTPIG